MPSLGLFSFCLLVLSNSNVSFCFILYYFILLIFFRELPNERKGVDPDGRKSEEEREEMQAQETVVRYIL